jgi:hypothetical protein
MAKNDKIFNNNFDSPDFELNGTIKFDLDPSVKQVEDQEERIHYDMIARRIHELIGLSRFKVFNEIDEFQQTIKLKKLDINEVYEYVSDEMKTKHSLVDVFSELSDYFNINPTRFYQSLGNKFKEELIEELDERTNILKRKNINRLF